MAQVRPTQDESFKGNVQEKRVQDLGPADTIHSAAEHDDATLFRQFLEAGASLDTNSGFFRWTPMHWAAYAGSCSVMQHVFDTSTDIELTRLLLQRDWLRKTPLHSACYAGRLKIVCMILMLEHEGRLFDDIFSTKDIFGKTPMMWARAQGHIDIVEVLLLRELFQLLPPDLGESEVNTRARSLILEAQTVALPRRLGGRRLARIPAKLSEKDHMEVWTDDIEPMDRTTSLMAPLPSMVHVGLSKSLIRKVVKACHDSGFNILLVLLRMKDSLCNVDCFPALEEYTQSMMLGILDSCSTKEQAQAVLVPLIDDPTTLTWPPDIPKDTVTLALEQENKPFIAHKHVQALLTTKFDPMGSYEYSSKASTVVFWALSALSIYLYWAFTFTWLLPLRPFSSYLLKFSRKGAITSDTRYPWHIPYNKWLASYMTLIVMASLMSNVVVHGSPVQPLKPEEIILICWALSTIIDKCVEGPAACLASGLHLLDLVSSIFYCGYFVARVSYVHQLHRPQEPSFDVITRASDMLAVSAFCSVLRLLGVFQVSPSMGPLLVMVRRMLIVDFAKFFTLLIVVFVAFGLAMVSLFKPLCVDGRCEQYKSSWDYNWQDHGLGGAIVHLLFQLFGVGSSQEAWAQKPVTGVIFFIVFIVIVGLLLINLLIAMLSTSYSIVQETSEQEYKFIRAVVIRDYGAREAIYPPLNVLHLFFGFIGNKLRLAWNHGAPDVKLVKLVQTGGAGKPFFVWYYPVGDIAEWYLKSRRILFQKFINSSSE